MKRFLVLISIVVILFSCKSKEVNNNARTAVKGNQKITGIVCNKFDIVAKLNDNKLILRVDTDLINYTDIIVTVSRSYYRKKIKEAYAINYFKEKAKISKWKSEQEIVLDNFVWNNDLNNLSFKDPKFEIEVISDSIEIYIVVPIDQSNHDFGKFNKNLSGEAVTHNGITTIRKEKTLNFPINESKIKENILKDDEKPFLEHTGKWHFNHNGIIGFGEAVRLINLTKVKEQKLLLDGLRDIISSNINKVKIIGNNSDRIHNTLNVCFKNIEGEAIIKWLEKYNIIVYTGSACPSTNLTSSHELKALYIDPTYINGAVRFSISKYTSKEDIDYVAKHLSEIVTRLREISPFKDS